MDELFTVSIEFFIFNDELWYRSEGKSPCRLKEQDYEFVTLIANLIEKFYPKAHISLWPLNMPRARLIFHFSDIGLSLDFVVATLAT